MKAFVVDAEWKPKKNYRLSDDEKKRQRALVGSQVWCNPHFEIKEVPAPNIDDNEVLIKVRACGICGSDTHLYETDDEGYIIFSGLAKLPCILGHEFSGIVEKTGSKVVGLKVGDKVTAESVMWCGICHSCRSGHPNQCMNIELLGLSRNGAFAEYIAIDEKYCWKINDLEDRYPGEKLFEIGTLIEPVGCAYNGIFVSGGGFWPGAYAIVYGAGPIGLGAVSLLKAAGAAKVIAVDVLNERLEIARKLGADYVFNSRHENDLADAIWEITDGWGADIQVEAAGAARVTMPMMERLYAKRGKIIYLGRAEASASVELNKMVSGAISLVGSRGHSGYGIFPDIIRLLQGDRLGDLNEMITSAFPFDEILKAFSASTERKDGKILITMG